MTPDSTTDRSPIIVPDIGPGIESLRVSAWLVDVGQRVVAGDRVAEVRIPGITLDIAATNSGELAEIVRPVDAFVTVGEIVGWIKIED